MDFELKYLPGEADKKFARAGKPAPGRHDSLEKEWLEIARAWVG